MSNINDTPSLYCKSLKYGVFIIKRSYGTALDNVI